MTAKAGGIAALIRASCARAAKNAPTLPASLKDVTEGRLAERLDDLKSCGAPPSHRRQSLNADELWDVAEHPAAPIIDRATAATVLAGTLDSETATRLRRLAKSSGDPTLSKLLRALAADRRDAARAAAHALEQR
jgi:hypothetical protein